MKKIKLKQIKFKGNLLWKMSYYKQNGKINKQQQQKTNKNPQKPQNYKSQKKKDISKIH